MNQRPGRNDPCHCGSGKKYKRCHMGMDNSGGTSAQLAPPLRTIRANPLILSAEERDQMRAAGRFNAQLMDFIRPHVAPGIRLDEIDRMVHEYTLDHGHTPATLGYHGFPKSLCTSVNEVVCHGIPDPTELRDGDIVNLDLTTIVEGWHGDQSETFLVGEASEEARRLTQCTFDALHLGIEAIRPYGAIIEIGRAIVGHAEPMGYSVVRDYQGHGIGRKFHQEPGVPHYPDRRQANQIIEPGTCFTIEPM
ncbi:MAG: type I methionyl aminopeptidase, partial [Planctomycetota bacterium]